MKVATEAIIDPYGGLYTHTKRFKKFSRHDIREIPSALTRKLIARSGWVKNKYRRALREGGVHGFDIVHSRSDPWFIDVARSSRNSNCKWVHTYHTLFFEDHYKDGLQSWHLDVNNALLKVANKADRKIVVSQWGHDLLKREYGIDTVVIRNGADLDMCSEADGERFKRKFGVSDFVLFVGSFREVKNPELYIKLAQAKKDRLFLMMGDGIDEGTLRQKYGIDIPDNLKLMGRVKHADVLDATGACSAYVMTSKSEGLPNGLLEAMALSRAVVVPDHTGCKELVGDSRFGYLYDINSFDDALSKLEDALNSGEETGKAARTRIESEFNWLDSAKRLDELYDSLK